MLSNEELLLPSSPFGPKMVIEGFSVLGQWKGWSVESQLCDLSWFSLKVIRNLLNKLYQRFNKYDRLIESYIWIIDAFAWFFDNFIFLFMLSSLEILILLDTVILSIIHK